METDKPMDKQIELVLATRNPGKIREIARLFEELAPDFEVSLVSASSAGLSEVEETGETFLENARQKAVAAAAESGKVCLGEDSGLEVDYLGGAPGVKSHRYSASGADADNNLKLLADLEGVPATQRTGRYRCAIVIAAPRKILAQAEGAVEGLIATVPSGDNGFGYDPLFYSVELGKTMGEALDAEKDTVSHRRRAMMQAVPALRQAMSLGRAPAEEGS